MKEIRDLIPNIYKKFVTLHNAEKSSTFTSQLTVNEQYYLDILHSLGKPTFTEFAEKAQITKPAATQIVKRLTDKGCVKKTQSEEDKRVYYIEIDGAVKKHFEECDIYLDKIYKNCLSLLSEDEKDNLENILFKIYNSLCEVSEKKEKNI